MKPKVTLATRTRTKITKFLWIAEICSDNLTATERQTQ